MQIVSKGTIDLMECIFDSVAEHYKTDFDHDKEALEGFRGVFVWVPRRMGSHLFRLDMSEEGIKWLRRNEEEPFLFARAKPQDQTVGLFACWNCESVRTADWHYYYDGNKLKKVRPDKSLSMFKSAYNNLLERIKDEIYH